MIVQPNFKPNDFVFLVSLRRLFLQPLSPFCSLPGLRSIEPPAPSPLSSSQLFCILRTATATGDLALGKCAHARILASVSTRGRFLTNNVITMYSKCGSLAYARRVFDGAPGRDLVTWNSILAAYAQSAEGGVEDAVEEGFALFHRLRIMRIWTSRMTLAPVLKLCLNSGYLWASEAIHGYAVKIGLESEEFVSGALVNIYSKFGRVQAARVLFEETEEKDVVLWNVMITGYAEMGLQEEAFKLFRQLQRIGHRPNDATLHSIVSLVRDFDDSGADTRIKDQVQAYAVKLFSNGNDDPDVISWNRKMAQYHRAGDDLRVIECFMDMNRYNVGFDCVTFIEALSAVSILNDSELGKQIHGMALRLGFASVLEVANSLINMYSKTVHISSAKKLFECMPERDLISWNSMISCHAQNGPEDETADLFVSLLQSGLVPDEFTLATVLRACSSAPEGLALSKQVHVHAVKTGNATDCFVITALIYSYSRNECLAEAEVLFERNERFDPATWNAMMFGYTLNNNSCSALRLFSLMHQRSEKTDQITLATVAKACGSSSARSQGKQLHAHVIKSGFEADLLLGSGVLDMYVKFGDMAAASRVFDDMSYRDEVVWTAMIVGCIENQEEDRAISIYRQTGLSGVSPDEYTLATMIKACSSLTALEQGRQIHADAVKLSCTEDPYVGTSLVDMYAKCGDIDGAYRHFGRLDVRYVALWNAMLVGLAQHGNGEEVLRLFSLMESQDIVPDRVTFIAVLSACSHSGLISKAHEVFNSMTEKYGIEPGIEHYSCLVDALGRAGRVQDAEKLIEVTPFRASASMYQTLLGACRLHGDELTGKIAADKLSKLEPLNSSSYALLSNIYAASKKWKDVSDVWRCMRKKNIKKDPGYSWINIKNEIHSFAAEDPSHPESNQIYRSVENLIKEIKRERHMPEMD